MREEQQLTKSKRRQLISQCLIDRYTIEETRDYIFKQTNRMVGRRTIIRDKKELGEEATKFFYLLAKDNHEYNQKLKITLDSLESTLSDLKQEYNNSTDITIKLKLADSLLKYEKEVFEYYKYLPTINQLEPEPEYTNTNTSAESAPVSTQQTEELYGLEVAPWDDNDWLQCDTCKRWFKNDSIIKAHTCLIV
jgi:hypothetical protein